MTNAELIELDETIQSNVEQTIRKNEENTRILSTSTVQQTKESNGNGKIINEVVASE